MKQTLDSRYQGSLFYSYSLMGTFFTPVLSALSLNIELFQYRSSLYLRTERLERIKEMITSTTKLLSFCTIFSIIYGIFVCCSESKSRLMEIRMIIHILSISVKFKKRIHQYLFNLIHISFYF